MSHPPLLTAHPPTVLVTGAAGLLGAHVMVGLAARGFRMVGTDRWEWWGDCPADLVIGELTEQGFISDLVARCRPDVLVHCAAMVSVDGCEDDAEEAYRVNADLTRDVARVVGPNCLVVYIQTDGLFSGSEPMAMEQMLPCPRTTYGRSKLHGEWEVQLATPNHIVVRTNFFGWSSGRKTSAAEWLYDALSSGRPTMLFDDFYFTPIYVVDLVERLWALIDSGIRGIVHLVGADRVSKYEFGMLLAAVARLPTTGVKCGSIETAGFRADRPKDMSLRSERIGQIPGLESPSVREGLMRFVAHRKMPLSCRFDRKVIHA